MFGLLLAWDMPALRADLIWLVMVSNPGNLLLVVIQISTLNTDGTVAALLCVFIFNKLVGNLLDADLPLLMLI